MVDKEHDLTPHLGIAGKMAKEFIHSPLSPLLLLACLAIGIIGLLQTPRQEDPQISVPMVDVFVRYSGASPEQVASLVTDPLERLMSEIVGVKHVYSASQREGAMVTVEFDVGEEMESSLVKLYDKLMSNMDRIPPGVSEPLVKPKGVDDVPVVTVTMWSNDIDDAALRLLALDVMQRLKEVPNTSQSFVVGGRSEQIKVEAMPERLAGFGITLDQIAQTIRTANSERGVGNVDGWGKNFKIYTGSFLKTARDVEQLVVAVRNDAPIYVRDVAKVSHEPENTKQMVAYYSGAAYDESLPAADGAAAVTLAVAKKRGSNGVTVANEVLAKVDSLKGVLIPANVQVAVTRNYGETANDKVNELIFKLFVATGIVTLLVFLFLGLRAAIVVLVVIPVVILVTVFAAWILGFTIDRVSLFALIFSIGILVDDAIVVVENMYRRWLMKGDIDTETSVDAVREVGNPTILATFTVIAALLPMGFVSGMMGPYMGPIPALGSIAMLFSLFAAFIFTPWLAMRLRPSIRSLRKSEAREHKQVARWDRVYRKLLPPLLYNRTRGWLFLIGIVAIFFVSMVLFYTTHVAVKMLPLDNKPEFNVTIDLPEGTALPITANLARRLADQLRGLDEVTAVQTYVGTASPFNFNGLVRHYYLRDKPWQGDIQVQLLHKRERERSSHEIAVAARAILTPIAREVGARIAVVEMPPGPPVLQSLVAEIYGPDAQTRRQVAADLTEIFERAESVTDVDNLMQEPFEVWRFEVDTEKAVRRGISVDTINRNLEMAMGGFVLGDVKLGHVLESTSIVLQVPMENRAEFNRIGNLMIPNESGNVVPLAELGTFKRGLQDPIIFHKDLRPVEFVVGDVTGRLAAPIYGMSEVGKLLEGYTAPDGVELQSYLIGPPRDSSQSAFEWTGEWTVTYETFRDMGMAFGAALILIYMLVVWEFGNFTLPAIVMAPIPLTLIGIVPGHWVWGAEFTATSMIGFIALAGIIVRNSILLVDFARSEILSGTEPVEALIRACKARTRPIIITAAALMGGSLVILTDPIFQGMAVSLFFGVLVSTLLTLLVIPLGCVSARRAFGCDLTPHPELVDAARSAGKVAAADTRSEPGMISIYAGLLAGMVWALVKAVASTLWTILVILRNYLQMFVSMAFSAARDRSPRPATAAAGYAPPTPPVSAPPSAPVAAPPSAVASAKSAAAAAAPAPADRPVAKSERKKRSASAAKSVTQTTARKPSKIRNVLAAAKSEPIAADSVPTDESAPAAAAVAAPKSPRAKPAAPVAKKKARAKSRNGGRRGIRLKTDFE